MTRKRRLCLRGDWQKEGVDFFKRKTFNTVLKSTMQESDRLYAVLTVTSLRHLPRANWTCLCIAFAHLDLSVQTSPKGDYRAEVRRSFITTTVREEPQVTPQGRHR